MELNEVIELCKRFKARCYISTTVRENGTIEHKYGFWGIDRKHVAEAMKMLGMNKMEKSFSYGDEDWTNENIKFNQVRKCKITGYKEEVVPERTIRTAIYDCTEH